MPDDIKQDSSRDQELLFTEDTTVSESPSHANKTVHGKPWKVVVIDDDENIHALTNAVLKKFSYKEQPLEIVNGYSGEEACKLMNHHMDCAVLLLDIVMETDNAGFKVVDYVRNKLNNPFVRIVIRTGQPGQFNEKDIVKQYEINDYRDKTELTIQKLNTVIVTALRSYNDLAKVLTMAGCKYTLDELIEQNTCAQ